MSHEAKSPISDGYTLVETAFLERLRDDLLMRAELDEDEIMVVDISYSIWEELKTKIQQAREVEK